jgi:hypothetical protein
VPLDACCWGVPCVRQDGSDGCLVHEPHDIPVLLRRRLHPPPCRPPPAWYAVNLSASEYHLLSPSRYISFRCGACAHALPGIIRSVSQPCFPCVFEQRCVRLCRRLGMFFMRERGIVVVYTSYIMIDQMAEVRVFHWQRMSRCTAVPACPAHSHRVILNPRTNAFGCRCDQGYTGTITGGFVGWRMYNRFQWTGTCTPSMCTMASLCYDKTGCRVAAALNVTNFCRT